MPKFDYTAFLQRLPPKIRDHIFDERIMRLYSRLFGEFGLRDAEREILEKLVAQVYIKEIALPNFIDEIQKQLGLSKEASKKLGVEIIGWDFLPIVDYLGVDVAGYLEEISVDPHIFVQAVDPAKIAAELAKATGLKFPEDKLRRRLEDIILNRLNNVRTDLQTKEVLTRSFKLGGLELGEEKASKVLELIKLELDSLEKKKIVLREEKEAMFEAKPAEALPIIEVKPRLEEELPPPAKPAPLPPPVIKPTSPIAPTTSRKEPSSPPLVAPQEIRIRPGDYLQKDEIEEVGALQKKAPKPPFAVLEIIKLSLSRVYEETGLQFSDPAMRARFEAIAANRLKDVRDSLETRDLLTRSVNLGGMGFSAEIADKVVKILDEEFGRVRDDLREEAEAEIKEFTRKKQEAGEVKKVETEKKEEQELETRWKKLVEKKRKKAMKAVVKPARPTIPTSPTNKISPISPIGQIGPIGPIKSSVQPPAVKLQPLVPSLEDVKFTPRLVGPLEELKNFSIDDLKKLSREPAQAAKRILEKLDILQSEAYEKKIAGTEALKSSPLWQMYREIISEALQKGMNPREIIASRKSAGKPALSEEEFNAIMELSARLKY